MTNKKSKLWDENGPTKEGLKMEVENLRDNQKLIAGTLRTMCQQNVFMLGAIKAVLGPSPSVSESFDEHVNFNKSMMSKLEDLIK